MTCKCEGLDSHANLSPMYLDHKMMPLSTELANIFILSISVCDITRVAIYVSTPTYMPQKID